MSCSLSTLRFFCCSRQWSPMLFLSLSAHPHAARLDWFQAPVDRELAARFSFRLDVILDYDAVTKGQDWDAVRNELIGLAASD